MNCRAGLIWKTAHYNSLPCPWFVRALADSAMGLGMMAKSLYLA